LHARCENLLSENPSERQPQPRGPPLVARRPGAVNGFLGLWRRHRPRENRSRRFFSRNLPWRPWPRPPREGGPPRLMSSRDRVPKRRVNRLLAPWGRLPPPGLRFRRVRRLGVVP
jgi:hypothetical protein